MAFLIIIGKITEGWITSYTMSFMQQIGALAQLSPANTSNSTAGSIIKIRDLKLIDPFDALFLRDVHNGC